MADLSQDQLRQLCEALGWQGGTFWQVLAAVKALPRPGLPAAVSVNLRYGNWVVIAPDGRSWALNDFEALVADVHADTKAPTP